MKQQRIIIASVFMLIASQALMAQSNSSSQRFDDGIYDLSEAKTKQADTKVETAVPVNISASNLAQKTAQSSMYVNPALTDTLVIPDLGTFSKKVNSVNINDYSTNLQVDSALIYSMVPQKNYTSMTINSTFSINFGFGPFWGRPWYWNSWAWGPWDPWYRPWGPWPYDPWYRPWPYHPYGPYRPYDPRPGYPVRVVRYVDSNSPNSFASGNGAQTGHRRQSSFDNGSRAQVATSSRSEVEHAPRSAYNSGAVRVTNEQVAAPRSAPATSGQHASSRYSNNGYNVAVGGSSPNVQTSAPGYRRSSQSTSPGGYSSGSNSYSRGSSSRSSSYSSGSRSSSGSSSGSGSSYSRSSSSGGGGGYSGGGSSGGGYSGGGSSGGGGGYSGGGGGGFSGGGSGHRR